MISLIKLEEPYTEAEGKAWIERCRKHQEAGGDIYYNPQEIVKPCSLNCIPRSYAIVQPEQGEQSGSLLRETW